MRSCRNPGGEVPQRRAWGCRLRHMTGPSDGDESSSGGSVSADHPAETPLIEVLG